MYLSNLRNVFLIALAVPLVGIAACSNKDNPDEIRRQTAAATETMRRDTKAVVEGVKEGMHSDKTCLLYTSRVQYFQYSPRTRTGEDRAVTVESKSSHRTQIHCNELGRVSETRPFFLLGI